MTNNYFLTEEEISKGQFDFNADAYAEKQQKFANDLEDIIGYELWPTKPRFAEYDYHIVNPKNHEFSATASIVPGVPILGIAELKYRTVAYDTYPTTVIDSDKLIKMKERVKHTDLPVLIFFRFTDGDKYYKVDLDDDFEQTLNRNTKTTADKRWELKPLTHIPIDKLKEISTIRRADGKTS